MQNDYHYYVVQLIKAYNQLADKIEELERELNELREMKSQTIKEQ